MRKIIAAIRVFAFISIAIAFSSILYLYLGLDVVISGLSGALAFFLLAYIAASFRYSNEFEKLRAELLEYHKDTDEIIRRMAEIRSENNDLKIQIDQFEDKLLSLENLYSSDGRNKNSDKISRKLRDNVKAVIGLSAKGAEVNVHDKHQSSPTNISRLKDPSEKAVLSNNEDGADDPKQKIAELMEKGDGIDIALQPILEIPHRRLKYYDVQPQLIEEDGRKQCIYAYRGGLDQDKIYADLDADLIPKIIHITRKVCEEIKNTKVFYRLSSAFLEDPAYHAQIIAALMANRIIASQLIFKIDHATYKNATDSSKRFMNDISDLGYAICLTAIQSFDFDIEDLDKQNINFLNIHSQALIASSADAKSLQHFRGLIENLKMVDIKIIADRVENETSILELLDLDISIAQGNYLAPARLVKPELIEGKEPSYHTA